MEFLNGITPSVWFALSGGLAIKLLEITEVYKLSPAERPDFKDVFYWIPFLVLPLLGGGLAQVYVSSDIVLSPLLAVNIGVSAPLILRAMVQAAPEKAAIDTPASA